MKEVRIVAPSMSIKADDEFRIKGARKYFEKLGFELTLGENIYDRDNYFGCSSIQNRVNDLMNAFLDKNVEIILCADGGYNVNQILPYLDYDIIRKNPKMIIGYSDITALLNAIISKTGQITYYGPMLTGFSIGNRYTLDYFEKILGKNNFMVSASDIIIDYKKLNGESQRVSIKNDGIVAIQNGKSSGKIIGGNLCTLNLLQGTEYMPSLNNVVLFLEDDADDFGNDVFLLEFDRNLESLLQSPDCNIKGIVFGRFQLCSGMTTDKLKMIINNKEKLRGIPIVTNVDFGHTNPMITIPLGGLCELNVSSKKTEIIIGGMR